MSPESDGIPSGIIHRFRGVRRFGEELERAPTPVILLFLLPEKRHNALEPRIVLKGEDRTRAGKPVLCSASRIFRAWSSNAPRSDAILLSRLLEAPDAGSKTPILGPTNPVLRLANPILGPTNPVLRLANPILRPANPVLRATCTRPPCRRTRPPSHQPCPPCHLHPSSVPPNPSSVPPILSSISPNPSSVPRNSPSPWANQGTFDGSKRTLRSTCLYSVISIPATALGSLITGVCG